MKFQIKRTSKFPHEEPLKGTIQETIHGQDIWTKDFNSLDDLMEWAENVRKSEKWNDSKMEIEGIILGYSQHTGLPMLEIYDTYRE